MVQLAVEAAVEAAAEALAEAEVVAAGVMVPLRRWAALAAPEVVLAQVPVPVPVPVRAPAPVLAVEGFVAHFESV